MHCPSAADESNLYKIRNKIASSMNIASHPGRGRAAGGRLRGLGGRRARVGWGAPGGGGRELELRKLLSYCVYIELCYVG